MFTAVGVLTGIYSPVNYVYKNSITGEIAVKIIDY
jgi:hypothetical protein